MTPRAANARRIRFSFTAGEGIRLAGMPLYSGTSDQLWGTFRELRQAGGRHLVITLNVDQVVDLRVNDASWEGFLAARIRLLDGMPLVWLARLLGARDACRNTGADLLPQAAADSARTGSVVVVLGGAPGVAQMATEELTRRFPGSRVRSVEFPFVHELADDRLLHVARHVAREEPDYVFVCLGAPKQEQWFVEWEHALPDAVYIGAGAAIDFAAGTVRRAPRWMQRVGLEWLWRLAQEPTRLFRRYVLKSPPFLGVATRSLLSRGKPAAREDTA